MAAGLAAATLAGCAANDAASEQEATSDSTVRSPAIDRTDSARTAGTREQALTTPHLVYNGGKLIQNVAVTQVLYGSGTYIPQLTSAPAPNMASAYTEMTGSGVFDWLSQYNAGSPLQTIGRGTFQGSVQISPAASRNGSTITDANIRAELTAQINAHTLPAPTDNQMYMVSFPAGKTITAGGITSCVDFCAYHDSFTLNGHNVYYGVLPDLSGACNNVCIRGSVFEQQQAVASHELIEAVTDPVPTPQRTGWDDPTLDEIGDICAPQTATYTGRDANTYTIQKMWSNKDNSCISGGELGQFEQDYSGLDFGLPSDWQVATGDFNGDGLTDYVRLGDTGAFEYLANGDGTFRQDFTDYTHEKPAISFGLPSPWDVVSGDFNCDGFDDYARIGNSGAWVFFGQPDRGFQPAKFTAYESPLLGFGQPSPWQTITGDFDGDGCADYARLGATTAWFFFGKQGLELSGQNFRQAPQNYQAGAPNFGLPTQWQVVTGNFDKDAKHTTDYARVGDTGAWVFHMNQFGSFEQKFVPAPAGLSFGLPSQWQVISGDFNGDGFADFARLGDTTAWFFFGSADLSLPAAPQNYQAPILGFGLPSPWQAVTGDFDGDGKTDYARLGSTGAWVFAMDEFGSFDQQFQTYANGVTFGLPSKFQVISGKFRTRSRTGYMRLGGPSAFMFSRPGSF